MAVAFQRPQEDLDYSHDYATELDSSGSPSDTIASSVWAWTENPDDGSSPSPELHDESSDGTVVSVWVRNLQPGSKYVLTNTTTTSVGRVLQHPWVIRCAYA